MRAVYQSSQAYLHLSYGEVNRRVSVLGCSYDEVNKRYRNDPHYVGDLILGDDALSQISKQSYIFCGGKEYNQITLTDPTEIRNMRAYIKRRADNLISEVLFEGDEAELEEPVSEIKAEKPNRETAKADTYDELSEWDKKLMSGMITR